MSVYWESRYNSYVLMKIQKTFAFSLLQALQLKHTLLLLKPQLFTWNILLAANYHTVWNYRFIDDDWPKIRFETCSNFLQFLLETSKLLLATVKVSRIFSHNTNTSRMPPNYTGNFVLSCDEYLIYFWRAKINSRL